MKRLLLFVIGLLAAIARAVPVSADPIDAVNGARMGGCGASSVRAPLQSSSKLQQAALQFSQGVPLHDAMRASGYLASQSSGLHLSGALSDAQVARLLAANYCGTLSNAALQEMGAVRRGKDIWMVLAAPVPLPAPADAAAVSRRVLALVNQARAAGARCGGKYFSAVAPLKSNTALTNAALAHSLDMATNGAFDHAGHDGSTPQARVQRAGYGGYRIVGENIAAGAMTAAEVAQGWLASPAHCENIMDRRFTETGIAFSVNVRSVEAVYWTEDFAARR